MALGQSKLPQLVLSSVTTYLLYGIGSYKTVSAAVGTSILAYSIFNNVPVRKEQYIKASKKSLSAIRTCLISFALLNRRLRITEKVLRSIVPPVVVSGGNTLQEAVLSCLGREIASTSEFVEEEFADGWIIEAVLPATGRSDTTSLASRRDYRHVLYAIDSRMMSNSLMTAKRLSAVTKKYINSPHRGLILCNIRTAPDHAAYDVNIEPAKDDILLYNEDEVLQKWESVLAKVYQSQKGEPGFLEDEPEIEFAQENSLLTANESETNNDTTSMHSMHGNSVIPKAHDISSNVSEAADDFFNERQPEDHRKDVTLDNPWTPAKMNKIIKPVIQRYDSPDNTDEFSNVGIEVEEIARVGIDEDVGESYVTPDSTIVLPPEPMPMTVNKKTDLALRTDLALSEQSVISDENHDSPSRDTSEAEQSDHEQRPRRVVHVHVDRLPPRPNARLATVPKQRSFFVTDPELQPLVIESESEEDVICPPKKQRKDGRANNSPHKNRQNAAKEHLITSYKGVTTSHYKQAKLKEQSRIPLEFIDERHQTYQYLQKLRISDSSSRTADLALQQMQNESNPEDPYFTSPTELKLKLWDDADLKSLLLSLVDDFGEGEKDKLKALVRRMDIFRGDSGWMEFA